jgi:hypothetical protein
MGIFRGPGGTGDATGDAANEASLAIAAAQAAELSKNDAANSAAQAATSASNASTSAGSASSSATSASNSASTASTQATNASNSASAAFISETNAANSASAALISETNAANLYDEFDDRYLGAKASDPTLDNDGDALITGALYFNTPNNEIRVWTGTNWVSGINADVTTVAGISSDVTSVAAIDSDVTTVAGISSDVTTVANISGNVSTVSGISSNVTTVAGISSDVTKVADVDTDVTIVASNDTNVATVGTNITNVNTVAGQISPVNNVATVAGNTTNINAVAANATNINTVAANNTNVTTVATNIASVNTNAANITAIQNASSNAINVANALTQVNSGQKDIFEDGTDFTTSVTDELTLSQTPAKANFVHVFFDTDYQASDTYTIVGNVITFDSAIVATKVEIVYDIATTLIEDALFNLADKRARAAFAREKNTPVIPSVLLDFESDKELDPRVTFARASTARYYDGKTVAKAEENLLVRSQDITTTWVRSNTTATADTTTAPDGTTTADTLSPTATTAVHTLEQTVSVTTGLPYFYSVFVKPNGNNFVQLYFSVAGFGTTQFANFDITAGSGAVGTVGAAATATITDAGNGWYRCTIVSTSTATSSTALAGIAIISSATSVRRESWATTGTESIFLWGAQLEQRSTVTAYTATTTQPITNYIPVLLSAANNEARFDHNPTTSESLGLLIEEQRTNLVTQSETFDNAAWTKTRSSITANTIVAPDGTLTGDKLVEDTTASNTHQTSNPSPVTSGTAYTISLYAKKAERNNVSLGFGTNAFPSSRVRFDLDSGNATIEAGSPTFTITNVGNGWYRCTITATATSTASANTIIFLNNGTSVNYTGDGYSGVYIWGAQLEAAAFPTSYIPTVASQVTRSADAASMTGTNFSSWYRQGEGTFLTNVLANNAANAGTEVRNFIHLNDGTNNNRVNFGRGAPANTQLRFAQAIGGTGQTLLPSSAIAFGTIVQGQTDQFTYGYSASVPSLVMNGVKATDITSGFTPVTTISQMNIGSNPLSTATSVLNGYVKKLAFYPKRLTNEQLEAITT